MVAEMPPRYNANEAETVDVNEIDTNPATTNATTEHADPSREEDAFLFYSDRNNLERALNFEEIDSTNQDLMPDPSTTARRTRITFERDSFSLYVGEFSGGNFDSDSGDDDDLDEEDMIQRIMRVVAVRRQQAQKLPQEEELEGKEESEASTRQEDASNASETTEKKAVNRAATAA